MKIYMPAIQEKTPLVAIFVFSSDFCSIQRQRAVMWHCGDELHLH